MTNTQLRWDAACEIFILSASWQIKQEAAAAWAGLVAASLLWSDCLIGAIMWPLVPASHRHPFPARPPPAAPVRALGQPVFTQQRSPGHCIQLSTQIFPLSGLKNVCKCLLNQIYKKNKLFWFLKIYSHHFSKLIDINLCSFNIFQSNFLGHHLLGTFLT